VTCTLMREVSVRGVAAAVPATVRTNDDIGGVAERAYVSKISGMVGVRQRRVVAPDQFGSHLAIAATASLLSELGWDPASIDLVVVATQTPDRLFPGIAFTVHRHFGLRQSCPVFDVNLGCSAFTHGIWIASSLLAGVGQRALLINTDTMSRALGAHDWGNQVLFGDAGTATALEIDPHASPMHVALSSDGKGTESVCLPHSAMSASGARVAEFVINGPAVLGLALRAVPRLVSDLLQASKLGLEDVGLFVPHQANVFILDKLVDRLGMKSSRVVQSMDRFGNTSSASIPLALCARREQVRASETRHSMMVGFGTGFSLSGVIADLRHTVLVEPVDVG
jgi:3-oxoacyl-[acyl-carrier-protein] synthase III